MNKSNETEKEQLRKEIIAQEEAKQIKYQVEGQEVTLSISIIKEYLTNNPNVTKQEAMKFLQICKLRKLNPFVGDVDLIKYGTYDASIIVKKEYFVKQARKSSDFDGMQAGIIIKNKSGDIEEREGAIVYDNEILIGGWCHAYLKSNKFPSTSKVSTKEYTGKKKDGTPNSQWLRMPATMIRKVAIAQALREAFPNLFNSLYDESEAEIIREYANNDAKEAPIETQPKKQTDKIKEELAQQNQPEKPKEPEIPQNDHMKEELKKNGMIKE